MKQLKKFNEFFLEEGVELKTAYVWDVDDTLCYTDDLIVITGGSKRGNYTTGEWAKIDKKTIDKNLIDLSNFNKGLSNARPIIKNVMVFVDLLNKKKDVFILTARGGDLKEYGARNEIQKDLIDLLNDVLWKLKIPPKYRIRDRLPIDRIITLTDPWVRKKYNIPTLDIPLEKAYFMKNILLGNRGYDTVEFWDDDLKNIENAKKIPGVVAHQV